MSLRILRNSTLRLCLTQSLRASYHNLSVHTTKGEFYIPAAYPDDFEALTLKFSNGYRKWDEVDATFSEAAVKADRGDVQFEVTPQKVKKMKTEMEMETEPNVHDM